MIGIWIYSEARVKDLLIVLLLEVKERKESSMAQKYLARAPWSQRVPFMESGKIAVGAGLPGKESKVWLGHVSFEMLRRHLN